MEPLRLTRPQQPFHEAGPAPDYSETDAWAVFDSKGCETLSVFYVHPTTHLLADTWNQTLAEARQDQMLLSQILPGQIRPFAEHALFAPHYRQTIFYAVAFREEDAFRAVHLARSDVERAFDQADRKFKRPLLRLRRFTMSRSGDVGS